MPSVVPILRAVAKDGEPVWVSGDEQRWHRTLSIFEGKEVEIRVCRKRKPRSLKENRYYWGIVIAMMAEAAGYEPEEMHDALRWEFLKVHGDGPLPTVRSTTELSTVEFEEYLSKCRMLASTMYRLYVPEPNEADLI